MATKALLIKSYETKTTGDRGKWNKLDQTASYIQGIETGQILDNMPADKLAMLISGVPSPWARAKLFRFALQTIANPDPNINQAGLLQFYKQLHGEWQGLLAVMALYPDRIKISEPIYMDTTGSDFNIVSAFGRMLFDEIDIWSNQDDLQNNPGAQPYIQLIYYKGHLVGGTSPLTGVFTGVEYNDLENETKDIRWYSNGKFESPMRYMDNAQLQKVYLFIKSLNANLNKYENKVNSQRNGKPRVDLSGFLQMLWQWENDLKNKGEGRLKDIGPVENYSKKLACPFNILFHSEVPVYLKPDYTFTYSDPNGEYQRINDIQSLLAEDTYVLGWSEKSDVRNSLRDAPVFFLIVNDITGGTNKYFSLPLSEQGIEIFKNGLSSILGYKHENQGVSISASSNGDILSVNMTVLIDGEEVALGIREYFIKWQTRPQKYILWPNFTSDKWNRYYTYSQQVDYTTQPKYLPIYQQRGKIIKTPDGHFFTKEYDPQDGSLLPVSIKILAETPADAGDSLVKYRVEVADKPLAGLLSKIRQGSDEVNSGFLIIKNNIVQDLSGKSTPATATIGFDFGSNNTCLYYVDSQSKQAKPIEFHNYRVNLVGRESSNPNRVADIDELIFFTNFDTVDGQFKSWLHEHDSRCVRFTQSEEIAGGVPVNRPNVQVNEMTDRTITTQAGTLHYNMKWLEDAIGLQKKKAYIKSLWLQACAFLYQKQIMPHKISWSYPGAMMPSDITELSKIFDALPAITPINGTNVTVTRPVTEAEAVCSYALAQKGFGLTSDNMFLGIDVGGSTSDILLLARDSKGDNSLLRESSVRLAAGSFFSAVTGSQRFREALVNFHGGHNTGVNIMNIEELMDASNKEKAPYYLNCIFDQLKPNEYKIFYDSLDENAKFVFTIPAYVTGALLYYAGILIGKTIKDYSLSSSLKQVEVLPFGKGGRLFHWLYSAAGETATQQYYSECLNHGIKCITDTTLDIIMRTELAENNKTEVARGLCLPQALNIANVVGKSDVCAEDGIKYRQKNGKLVEIPIDKELDGSYFKELSRFEFGHGLIFDKFMNIFCNFVCRITKIYNDEEDSLRKEIRDVPGRIMNFIKNDSEYAKAESSATEAFSYHQPVFIAEVASYLYTLIGKIFAY